MSDTATPDDLEPGGFKRLTIENWSSRDPAMNAFGSLRGPLSDDDWARVVLSYDLSADVPEEVRSLWSIARGIMLYGCFFYPLWTIGDEQLHRVVDAAVAHAYEKFDGPTGAPGVIPTFQSRIDWLVAKRYIHPQWKGRWTAIKDVRNYGSHPFRLTIVLPGNALDSLRLFRDEINQLFASDEPMFVGAPKWKAPADAQYATPKRLSAGDRYALAGELEGALELLESCGEEGHAVGEVVSSVRERLLGAASGQARSDPPL